MQPRAAGGGRRQRRAWRRQHARRPRLAQQRSAGGATAPAAARGGGACTHAYGPAPAQARLQGAQRAHGGFYRLHICWIRQVVSTLGWARGVAGGGGGGLGKPRTAGRRRPAACRLALPPTATRPASQPASGAGPGPSTAAAERAHQVAPHVQDAQALERGELRRHLLQGPRGGEGAWSARVEAPAARRRGAAAAGRRPAPRPRPERGAARACVRWQLASFRHSRPVRRDSVAVSSPSTSWKVFWDRSSERSCQSRAGRRAARVGSGHRLRGGGGGGTQLRPKQDRRSGGVGTGHGSSRRRPQQLGRRARW